MAAAPDKPAVSSSATIAKLTPVTIEILDPLGSKTSASLDHYRISLVEPIMVDGVEIIPAGTTGMGEVVHTKKAGGMGAAGELVLAARYLDFGGRQLRLRSMELLETAEGKSRTNSVNALNAASAASPIPIGLIGYFITGGNIDIPAGALASAKIAAEFVVDLPRGAAPVTAVEAAPVEESVADPEGGTDVIVEGIIE